MDVISKDIIALINLFQKDKAEIDEILTSNPASYLARLLQIKHEWNEADRPEELIQHTALYAGNSQWYDFLINRLKDASGEAIVSDHFAVNIPKENVVGRTHISEMQNEVEVIGEVPTEHENDNNDFKQDHLSGPDETRFESEKAQSGSVDIAEEPSLPEESIETFEHPKEQLQETEVDTGTTPDTEFSNEENKALAGDLEGDQQSEFQDQIISEGDDRVNEQSGEYIENDWVKEEESSQPEQQEEIVKEEDIHQRLPEVVEENNVVDQDTLSQEENQDDIEKEKYVQEIPAEESVKNHDQETAGTQSSPLAFEPLHTVDYFASQGIRLNEADLADDKLSQQVKSFTGWLKSMKKLHPGKLPEQDEVIQQIIQNAAEVSNVESDVLTEAMADVLVKQNKKDKAIEMYEKLSLMNPSKSAYFAAKILSLKTP